MVQLKTIPLEEKFRILFRIFNDIIERKNLSDLTSVDLSYNQFIILKILAKTGRRSVSDLASALNITNAAASMNVDYLVKQKLINRKIDSDDRRKVDVSILKNGEKIVDRYDRNCEKKFQSVVSHYSKKDQILFNKMIDKFIYCCIEEENNLSIFCLQCGGKYEGNCPIGDIKQKCYFKLDDLIHEN